MRTLIYAHKSFSDISDWEESFDNNRNREDLEYSKFKHGSKRVARKFGKTLGSKFSKDKEAIRTLEAEGKPVVVCSAPYKYIPVASTGLKDYFFSEFNLRWSQDKDPAIDLKVFRGHSYNDDYGSMTSEERKKVITSDDFYIDAEFIKGKTLIFIDDIRITGSHEEQITEMLEKVNFDGLVIFVYYAALSQFSKVPASIENQLNYAFVKGLMDVNYIIKNDEFMFNTRVVKYILKADPEEFKTFIQYQSNAFIHSLRTYLMGNGYHKIPEFAQNCETLKTNFNK